MVTRQIVDLAPKIYDTQRIARIIGLDGETSMAKIDPTQPQPVRKIVDQTGVVIDKIYNLGVGKYDVRVTTGPSYLTKRQQSMEAMQQILQGNPQLWGVAGDLFIKNMDWPGAQEMADRFRKTMDPKLFTDEDDPALQAAQQQLQAQQQQIEQLGQMLEKVGESMQMREVETKEFDSKIKAFDAETKRIVAFQNSLGPEQIQDIVMGTLAGMMSTNDLVIGAPAREQEMPPEMMMPMQQELPLEQMPNGA